MVPTTVFEALVNAGGFKDFANKKKIEIIRGDAAVSSSTGTKSIKGKNLSRTFLLEPGDIIIVP